MPTLEHYKRWVLNLVKEGKANLNNCTTENFMKETKHLPNKLPQSYINLFKK